MSKLLKRIKKNISGNKSSLIIGNAFGRLEEISESFKTVFVVSNSSMEAKSKNIIYRENFDNITDIGEVSVILVDIDKLDQLELMSSYWTRYKPTVLIEGNEILTQLKNSYLYKYGYRCVDQIGYCHVWKNI
jgi:peptide methionine sulfoxide reductase MsrA